MRATSPRDEAPRPARAARRGPRAFAANLALLAAASVAAAGAGEALLRAFLPQELPEDPRRVHPKGIYAPHPTLGFTMTPGFEGRFRKPEFDTRVRLNAIGIRDRERGAGAGGTRRVLVLGDSYTFGWGVEEGERFVDRLEELLNARGGARWDVIKAGTNAYGTREELGWLREFGWALEPDLVVLQFCVGNDIADNMGAGHRVVDGYLVPIREGAAGGAGSEPATPRPPWARVKRWLHERSHLYVFVRDRARWLRLGVGARERALFEVREFNRSVLDGLPRTEALLEEMAGEARRRGVPLVVVIVPMRHQVYGPRSLGRDLLDAPTRAVAASCERLGIPVVDLLPGFRERAAAGAPPLYFRRDRHWTREGHRLAGDLLFEALVARGLPGAAG